LEEQNHRIERLMGKVEIIVTDSPIILGSIYLKEPNSDFEETSTKIFNERQNFNVFIERDDFFESEGRIHNYEESLEKDNEIKALLRRNDLNYGEYGHDAIKTCVCDIESAVKKAREKINFRT